MRYLPVDESLSFNIRYRLPLQYKKYKIQKSKVYYIEGEWGEYFSQDGNFNGFGYEYNLSNTGGNLSVKGQYRKPVICILYMLKGGVEMSDGNAPLSIAESNSYILYLPKGMVQWHLVYDFSNWFMLIVKPAYIKSLFKNLDRASAFFRNIVINPGISHIIHAGSITQAVKKQVKDICKYRSESPEWELTLSAYGKNLLIALSNSLRRQLENDHKIINEEQITKYVLEHIESAITIDQISKAFGINTTAVKRLFRKMFSSTVHDFIMQQRLHVAKELLLITRDSVYTIAMRSGFSDTSHFARQFKLRTGVTPSAYRQGHKDNGTVV
ncbi:MAG: AraC family transcriptional regulator [Agriterribacter sp.]